MQKTPSLLNREWHLTHKMPKNPSLEQRIQRHTEHAKHCHCREMSEKIKKMIETKKK
jgi:hypothetical protein